MIIKKIKENIGNETNPNSIYLKLSSIKIPISVKTTYNYVSFLKMYF
jgi:predicted AAA+ superfamily ATPase